MNRLIAAMILLVSLPAWAGDVLVTKEFRLDKRRFSASGSNTYMTLNPGTRSAFAGEEDGRKVEILTTVLDRRRWVSFDDREAGRIWVRTRVVEERKKLDGELVEISRKFFARCKQTSDIYYFGRRVWLFREGIFAGSDGTWEAGVKDALPGLVMPGTFLLGSRYDRKRAPGSALSRVEHTAMELNVSVRAGDFSGCVEVAETITLEPSAERSIKVFCPGVGLVLDGVIQLVDYRPGSSVKADDN